MKLDYNTPLRLATLFIFLIREGITPDQIMVGIIQLANDTHDLHGIQASVECLRSLLEYLQPKTTADGVSAFILSLAAEDFTTLMLLNALKTACHECELVHAEELIRIAHQKLLEAKIRRNY